MRLKILQINNQCAHGSPGNQPQSGRGLDRARRISALYKRAAVASGLIKRMLPGRAVSIEHNKPPDFAELDRCLNELSALGVHPFQQRLSASGQRRDLVPGHRSSAIPVSTQLPSPHEADTRGNRCGSLDH